MTTTDRDAESWADNRAPTQYRETMPYIPLGVTQQGRLKDGQRIQPAGARADVGADQPLTEQDIGEAMGNAVGWFSVGLLAVMLAVHFLPRLIAWAAQVAAGVA